MSVENALQLITMNASADLSAKQFYFMGAGASGISTIAAQGTLAVGVLQNKPAAANRAALVAIGGVTKVVAASAIAKGANVTTTAAGKAETAASGDYIMGIADSAATADGDIISLIFNPSGRVA